MLAVGGTPDRSPIIVRQSVQQLRPDVLEGGDVAVMNEKRGAPAKRVSVFVGRLPDSCPSDMSEKRGPFRAEGLFTIRIAFVSGLYLPDAVGASVHEACQAPSVRIRKAPRIRLALIQQGILRIEEFAGRTRRIRGLEGIEAAHRMVKNGGRTPKRS